jgi:kinetochore protein NNF1
MPFLEKQATDMDTKLLETQAANTELLATVTAQRIEIEALVRGLEGVVSDLEASAQLMAQDDVQDLSSEIRDAEMGMRT